MSRILAQPRIMIIQVEIERAMTIKVVFTPQSRLAGSPLELLRRESFEMHKRIGAGVAISIYHIKDCALVGRIV